MEAKAQGILLKSARLFTSATMVPTLLTLLATLFIFLIHHILSQFLSKNSTYPLNSEDDLSAKRELTGTSKIDFFRIISHGTVGAVLVVILFYLTQKIQPFYFTEDDNFSQFLPVILTAMESFFRDGRIHTWNPYQLLGSPTVEVGVYSLTYPFTYLSFLVAKYFYGNKFATLEVFAFFHIFVGYWVTYLMLRLRNIRASIATAGALTFMMSGFTLIAGRSWYYMLPGLVWIPFLFLLLSTLPTHKISGRWIALTGAAIAIYFHAGNAQMWVYSIGFWFIAFLLNSVSKKSFIPELCSVGLALCIGIALCMPLALPQSLFLSDIARDGGGGMGIYDAFLFLFIPYPFSQFLGFKNSSPLESLYYVGTWFPLFGMLSLASAITLLKSLLKQPCHNLRNWCGTHTFSICLVIVLLFALGIQGHVWTFFAKFPLFSKFNHPFKFLQLVSFFFMMSGAVYIENSLSRQANFGKWCGRTLSVLVFGTLAYSVSNSKLSFFTFGDAPYPTLPAELTTHLLPKDELPGRVLTFATNRDPSSQYVLGLPHNFPSVYGVHSMLGYDPLVGNKPENLFELMDTLRPNLAEGFRELGIRWVLVHRSGQDILTGKNKETMLSFNAAEIFQDMLPDLVLMLKLPDLDLYENVRAKPLVFWEHADSALNEVEFKGQGVTIKVPSSKISTDNLIVNVLFRKNFGASVNSERVAIKKDPYGRILIPRVPPGATVELLYSPPWGLAFFISTLLLGLGTLGYVLAKKLNRVPELP
jgi:hypothetical protein